MSEENIAKEYFKKYIKDFERRIGKKLTTEFNEHLKVLLSQVEKQQKEIEENQVLIDDIKEHNIVYIDTPEFEEKYISKDKIRDMLNYLDNTSLNNYEIVMAFRKMMKELLEENDGDHIPRID